MAHLLQGCRGFRVFGVAGWGHGGRASLHPHPYRMPVKPGYHPYMGSSQN